MRRKVQPLTMDPPCYIDVEECQEKYHRAEKKGDHTLEPERPGGPVARWELDWKGGGASGAVFGVGVGNGCRFGAK